MGPRRLPAKALPGSVWQALTGEFVPVGANRMADEALPPTARRRRRPVRDSVRCARWSGSCREPNEDRMTPDFGLGPALLEAVRQVVREELQGVALTVAAPTGPELLTPAEAS